MDFYRAFSHIYLNKEFMYYVWWGKNNFMAEPSELLCIFHLENCVLYRTLASLMFGRLCFFDIEGGIRAMEWFLETWALTHGSDGALVEGV